jgi:hypothetical protein
MKVGSLSEFFRKATRNLLLMGFSAAVLSLATSANAADFTSVDSLAVAGAPGSGIITNNGASLSNQMSGGVFSSNDGSSSVSAIAGGNVIGVNSFFDTYGLYSLVPGGVAGGFSANFGGGNLSTSVTGLGVSGKNTAGTQTFSVDSETGNASFNGTLTVGGQTTLNGGAAVKGGLEVKTGGLIVDNGQTVSMGGNTVTNVGGPVNATDAANKAYVDAAVGTIGTNLQAQINALGRRDKELAGGIAIATALATPTLLSGQTFAMRGGWGTFDGAHALSFNAAGLLSRGFAGQTSSLVIDAGVGHSTDTKMTTGRAGVTIGW